MAISVCSYGIKSNTMMDLITHTGSITNTAQVLIPAPSPFFNQLVVKTVLNAFNI